MSGLETTEPQLGRLNLANTSSRSMKNFFSVSNNIGDGSEAVQKKQKKDLDGELDNMEMNRSKNKIIWKKIPLRRWLNNFSYPF